MVSKSSSASGDSLRRFRGLIFGLPTLKSGKFWYSSRPLRASLLQATAAISFACLRSALGSADQSTLTRVAKHGRGLASIPTLGIPNFLHSTGVVPVPQKGSRTTASPVSRSASNSCARDAAGMTVRSGTNHGHSDPPLGVYCSLVEPLEQPLLVQSVALFRGDAITKYCLAAHPCCDHSESIAGFEEFAGGPYSMASMADGQDGEKKVKGATAVRHAAPSKSSRKVSCLSDSIWRRRLAVRLAAPSRRNRKSFELRSSISRHNLLFRLVAPFPLSRKVLKLPVQSGTQDNPARLQRQSNSDGNSVQICGRVCKKKREAMK